MPTDGTDLPSPGGAAVLGAEELRAGGVLFQGPVGADLRSPLGRLLAPRRDVLHLVPPAVRVPLGPFLPLLGGSGAGIAPPAVLIAGRVRTLLAERGIAVLAVEDAADLDPVSAGLLARLAREGVALALAAPDDADLPAALPALLGGGRLRTVGVEGPPASAAGPTFGQALRSTLRALPTDERRAAELIGLGGRLELELARALSVEDAVPDLEAAGIAVRARDGSIRSASAAAADAVRAGIPAARRRRRFAELAEARRRAPGDDLPEQVALIRWSLEAGDALPSAMLQETARRVAAADAAGAELLLRAAVEAGGGVPASLRLADLLADTGRVEEALGLLEGLERAPLDPDAFLSVRIRHALLLALPGNRPGDALRILDDLDAETRRLPAVEAVRAGALTAAGRVREAHLLARTLQDGHPVVAAGAALAAARALLHFGEVDEFEEAVAHARPLIRETADAIPDGFSSLRVIAAAGDVMLGGRPACRRRSRPIRSPGRTRGRRRGAPHPAGGHRRLGVRARR
ncbi:MAG TPA: hypothetical protein VIL55_14955 [Naasia sp.]